MPSSPPQAPAYYAVLAIAVSKIAANAGCYRPVTVVVPEGLIVVPRHPAPVADPWLWLIT
jgi:N-methylhydantoinase B/oxoprolinase/acetone carboxylase alpha subunit